MARLFDDASSEYLEIDSAPVTAAPFSMAAWIYTDDVATADDQSILFLGDKGVSNRHWLLRYDATDAGDMLIARARHEGTTSSAVGTTAVTVNTWIHAGASFGATTRRRVYFNGTQENEDTNAVSPTGADRISIGRAGDSSPGDYFSGRLAEVCLWNVELTDAEYAVLAAGYSPLFVRPQNLIFYTPLIRDEDYDRVGGLNLTAFNTPTIAPHPPMIYPAPVMVPSIGEAGGITYEQAVAGTLTTAGAYVGQGQKVLTGGLTPAGVYSFLGSFSYAGAMTPAGTVVKTAILSYAGTLTPAGVVSGIKTALKALVGALTPAGTVVGQGQKALAGSLATAGAIIRQGQKVLAGAITPTGVVAGIKTALKALAGTLTSSGALVGQGQKVLAGSLASAGAVVKETALSYAGTLTSSGTVAGIKTAVIALAGTLTSSGALVGQGQKVLAGTLTSAGTIIKTVSTGLAGTLTTAGAAVKKTAISLAGTLTFVGAIATELNAILESIGLTLRARSTSFILGARSMAFTLKERAISFTLRDRE